MVQLKKAPNPVDKYIGSRIRMRRLFLRMSLEELAKALELTYQQVQKYEKGANRVSASRLLEISSALRVPPAFFFEGMSGPPAATRASSAVPSANFVTDFLATAEGLELMRAFIRIRKPKLRLSLVHLVQEMTSDKN